MARSSASKVPLAISDSFESCRSGRETPTVARSRVYSSSRLIGASFGAECERNSSALPRVPCDRRKARRSRVRRPGIPRDRSRPRRSGRSFSPRPSSPLANTWPSRKAGPTWSVPRLFMRTTPSIGENSARTTSSKALRIFASRRVVAVTARPAIWRMARRASGTSSLRSGRWFSRRAPISSSASRKPPPSPSKITFVTCASWTCMRNTPRAGERVVERDFGFHEPVAHVQRRPARRRWRARRRAKPAGRAARGMPRTTAASHRRWSRRR